MILSNVEIQRALDERRLVIKPEPLPRRPTPGEPHCPYDTHSVDVTLAPIISVPKAGAYVYDPSGPNLADTIARNSDRVELTDHQPYVLKRNVFVLGMTREKIELPLGDGSRPCLAARIEGKSSRARCGLLIHFTAPTVHPGWRGPLTLEMINLGAADIVLRPGMAIAQLIFEEVRGVPFENESQFQGQGTPPGTK